MDVKSLHKGEFAKLETRNEDGYPEADTFDHHEAKHRDGLTALIYLPRISSISACKVAVACFCIPEKLFD